MELLIKFGANVNLTNSENKTPLHCAAISGHLECFEILLKEWVQVFFVNLYIFIFTFKTTEKTTNYGFFLLNNP